MSRAWPAAVVMALLLGACSEQPSDPARLSAKEKEAIEAARRAVEQYEDWAGQAEFKIERHKADWQVTAWKVVHPEAKGNMRYVPWGRSTIIVDEHGKVTEYRRGK